MKINNNKQSEAMSTNPMTRLGWISLVLALASQASGFQSKVSVPVHSLRKPRTEGYGNDIFAVSSRSSIASSRLQYRATTSEEASTTVSPLKWFNTIFPRSQESEEDNEQESVDEYLEFLDRRYRRLHSAEKEEEVKPFSALTWLGVESRNEATVTQQQHEDALYVLGVAGLASQKLLQKHSLPVDEEHTNSKAKHTHSGIMAAMDADIVQTGPAALLIKKVLVPFIRVFYIAQRRKEMFVASQLHRVKMLLGSTIRTVAKSARNGPMAATKTILEVGGGKKSLAVTATFIGATLLLLRPILQALAEGSVRP
jgi:hypothetical protein